MQSNLQASQHSENAVCVALRAVALVLGHCHVTCGSTCMVLLHCRLTRTSFHSNSRLPAAPCHCCLSCDTFFELFVPRDKLMKCVTQLAGLRELLDSKDPEGILLG
jgi:hypothetical protein